MKLDRNISADGRGKYGLILIRKLDRAKDVHSPQGLMEIEHAVKVLESAGIIDWGNKQETEFFVMRLKDRYAQAGLMSYATAAICDADGGDDNDEYANEIYNMAHRSGPHHPLCKKPD